MGGGLNVGLGGEVALYHSKLLNKNKFLIYFVY
jgi:hypothetical protein